MDHCKKNFRKLVFASSVLLGAALTAAPSGPPVTIGSRLELFVDDYLIERMKGVELKMHRPIAGEVVFTFDAPWEGNNNWISTVFKDDSLYRMYYRSVPGRENNATGEGWLRLLCYAESTDGINWTRPNLGQVEFKGSKENNILAPDNGGQWLGDPAFQFTPFFDTNPAAPAAERYKALAGIFYFESEPSEGMRGYWGYSSPDGIHWKQIGGTYLLDRRHWPVHTSGATIPAFWSEQEACYVAYMPVNIGRENRLPVDFRQVSPDLLRWRWIGRSTSKDFLTWTKVEILESGSAPMEHLYTSTTVPYYRAPHLYFAFPLRYQDIRQVKLPAEYDRLRGTGLSDSGFMSSRDGRHWDRRFMESFVRPGLNPLNWVDRSNGVVGLVPTGENEMSVYIQEGYRLPYNRVRRGRLRLDGITSVQAGYGGGELITKPLVFGGRRLMINYSTSAVGSLRVEFLDSDFRPIPGYALDDAVELFGDSTAQEVSWHQGSDVSRFAGTPLRLRFVLKDADLFSFRFGD